jgi:hypothetical protein
MRSDTELLNFLIDLGPFDDLDGYDVHEMADRVYGEAGLDPNMTTPKQDRETYWQAYRLVLDAAATKEELRAAKHRKRKTP